MPKLILAFAACLCAVLTACTTSQTEPAFKNETQLSVVQAKEIRRAVGDGWQGILAYTDYGTGELVEIPVRARVKPAEAGIMVVLSYPDEPEADTELDVKLSIGGRLLNDAPIVSRDINQDEVLVVRTRERGYDDNRPAIISRTWKFSERHLGFSRDVAYLDNNGVPGKFLFRNAYTLMRPPIRF